MCSFVPAIFGGSKTFLHTGAGAGTIKRAEARASRTLHSPSTLLHSTPTPLYSLPVLGRLRIFFLHKGNSPRCITQVLYIVAKKKVRGQSCAIGLEIQQLCS